MRSVFKRFLYSAWLWDADRKVNKLSPHLDPGWSCLEIGMGPGSLSEKLQAQPVRVTGLDLDDKRWFPQRVSAPVIGDGARLPYHDQCFDLSLLFTVLHHCPDPLQVLAEAYRVSAYVAIIEDILPQSPLLQRALYAADSLANWQFKGHPHSNRNHESWEAAFHATGLRILHTEAWWLGPFQQRFYFLGKYGVNPGDQVLNGGVF